MRSNYRVRVIKPGYAESAGPGQQRADGSITLVTGRHKVIVDTGGAWDKQAILRGLRAEGLKPVDIDFVVCTHGHSDHVGNLNLFPGATIILSYDVCKGDLYSSHDFQRSSYKIDDDIEVIATPGHTKDDVSVVVRTPEGVYVIAGDLFECAEDLENPDLWQRYSEHLELHEKSRTKVLELADFIVPGHGDIFEVTKHPVRKPDKTDDPGIRSKLIWFVAISIHAASRMGGPTLTAEIERTIGKAVDQVGTTASLITERHPKLAHIPADRPIYGLVVALEPYHFVQVDDLARAPSLPVSIASISDFERFVADCIDRPRSEPELAAHSNPNMTGWDVRRLIEQNTDRRLCNPMLDAEHDELMALSFGSVAA